MRRLFEHLRNTTRHMNWVPKSLRGELDCEETYLGTKLNPHTMNKLFKVIPPRMPNFIRFEKEKQLRQEGFKVDEAFDIAQFTETEAIEFAELMKTEFLKHWKIRRDLPKLKRI